MIHIHNHPYEYSMTNQLKYGDPIANFRCHCNQDNPASFRHSKSYQSPLLKQYYPKLRGTHISCWMGLNLEISSTYTMTCSLPNLLILGKLMDGPYVLVSEAGHGCLVILLGDVVCLNHSGKHWKSIGSVQWSVVVIGVYTSKFLISEEKTNTWAWAITYFHTRHFEHCCT